MSKPMPKNNRILRSQQVLNALIAVVRKGQHLSDLSKSMRRESQQKQLDEKSSSCLDGGLDGIRIRYYSLHSVNSYPSYKSTMLRSFLPTLWHHPLHIFGIVELGRLIIFSL